MSRENHELINALSKHHDKLIEFNQKGFRYHSSIASFQVPTFFGNYFHQKKIDAINKLITHFKSNEKITFAFSPEEKEILRDGETGDILLHHLTWNNFNDILGNPIEIEIIIFNNLLDKGAYGVIYKAKFNITEIVVKMSKFTIGTDKMSRIRKALKNEAAILLQLQIHPNNEKDFTFPDIKKT